LRSLSLSSSVPGFSCGAKAPIKDFLVFVLFFFLLSV
jgi:hypothetical protein